MFCDGVRHLRSKFADGQNSEMVEVLVRGGQEVERSMANPLRKFTAPLTEARASLSLLSCLAALCRAMRRQLHTVTLLCPHAASSYGEHAPIACSCTHNTAVHLATPLLSGNALL